MTTHALWLDIILNPQILEQKFKSSEVTESETFDLLVHLINNGISLLSSITAPQNNAPDEIKKNVESKKYKIIQYLVFKLLSNFKWDLHKILATLPSHHQEFIFNEFKRFCEQDDIPNDWKNFSICLYHRWVLHFVIKSIYPNKPQKIGLITANQQFVDPYFVSPEIHEVLVKRFQNLCLNSLSELEKLASEFEYSPNFDISMPTFDCFVLEDFQKLTIIFDKSKKFDKSAFLDEIFYELGKWHFVHEDYAKADNYFDKIVAFNEHFACLEEYKLASKAMNSKDYKMNEPKEAETCEKRIMKYLQTIVREHSNLYGFDSIKSSELKKVVQAMKKFNDSCATKEETFLLNRLAKYLIFRTNGLYGALDQNSRSLFLNMDKASDPPDDVQMIEEGEINADEELTSDDDPELMLLEAVDPDEILRLIPSIKKSPLNINSKWILPEYQMMLMSNPAMSRDYHKCHFILAKANELRNAKYFSESRTLYLSLMEDIQTSNPQLAEVIQYELLQTDLETFFGNSDVDERMIPELENKCLLWLRNIDKDWQVNGPRYLYFMETIELACIFLVDNSLKMRDFVSSPIELLRFCACLSYLKSDVPFRDNDKRARELWEFALGRFIEKPPNTKFPFNFVRIPFFSSFENFISKFKNSKVINVIANCLIKIYSAVKDNPSQMNSIQAQHDLFPFTLPSNVSNVMDLRTVSLIVDKTLRNYIETNPNDLQLLKYYGDYILAEGLYSQAMKYFVRIVMLNTKCFANFDYLDSDDLIVQQMIICSTKMGAHIQAAVLYQLSREPDYGLAFKELNQGNSFDSSDDLYECIWDITLLEYLVNHHTRRGDDERRLKATRLVSQLDLNINNGDAILKEAANLRKSKLFRMLAKLYM